MTLCLQEFAVPNCVEGATYDPWKALSDVTTYHNYRWVVVEPLELSVEVFFCREGNLPPNSKCAKCRKICSSDVCLTGMRCCWCGMTAHSSCLSTLPEEMQVCRYGVLEPIFLPPTAVSIPRTQVNTRTYYGSPPTFSLILHAPATGPSSSCPTLRHPLAL